MSPVDSCQERVSKSESHIRRWNTLFLLDLGSFDEKRESSGELLKLGSTLIEILEVNTKGPIGHVRRDNRFEYMSHVITTVVESRDTTLLMITYHLVDPHLLLRGSKTFLRIVVLGLLG